MNNNENKTKGKNILKILLIIALAIIVGFGGSIGYQIYKSTKNNSESSNIIMAPVKTEIEETGSNDKLTSEDTDYSSKVSNLSVSTSDISALVECMMPAVVSIDCVTTYTYNTAFGRYSQSYEETSSGTGFFVSQNKTKLFIVTNNKVIDGVDSVTVTLNNGTKLNAEIVGTDVDYDIAVLSLNIKDLTQDDVNSIKIATLGDSDSLAVGSMSVAIGNSLGYGQSTTVGYISAVDRTNSNDGTNNLLIQTDTAINPGNSGGPLLNIYGQVIGITSVNYGSTEVEGMCYAIPISTAIPIINDLISYITIDESEIGYLGIEGQDISESYSKGFGMPMGIYIYAIAEDSPAASSELRSGDIITGLNGRSITTMSELVNRLSHIRAGESIDLTVCRLIKGSYEEYTFTITLSHRP